MKKQLTIILLLFFCNFSFAQDWNQILKVAAGDRDIQTSKSRATNDYFGYSVDIDGDYAVVGSYKEDDDSFGTKSALDAGSVFIFKNTNGNWKKHKKLTALDRTESDLFGVSVSISGNNIIVGANKESHDSNGLNTLFAAGSAYIFNKDQNGMDSWGLVKKIVASDRTSSDNFGVSVDIHNDIVIIGANINEYDSNGLNLLNGSGSAYIFYKDQGGANNWGQIKKITANVRGSSDSFGNSVSIFNDLVVVGANFEDEDALNANTLSNAGSAYIFSKNQGGNDNWGLITKIVASDRASSDSFGTSVSINNLTIVVGANLDDESSISKVDGGAVYVYYKDFGGVNNWGQLKKINASDKSSNDLFGISVAIEGNTILVGAQGKGTYGYSYIFEKDLGGIDNWGQLKTLKQVGGTANDFFGKAVAISGDNVLIGAFAEDEDENSLNTITDAGSCFLFSKNTGGANNWGLLQKIVQIDYIDYAKSNFSKSVAIDGNYAIIGSIENLDENNNNSILEAGAAYIFKNNNGIWTKIKKISASKRDISFKFGSDVAISGNTIAISSPNNSYDASNLNPKTNGGSVFIYSKDLGGIDNWGLVKIIIASDRNFGDYFGTSIALNGSTLVVGAPDEDEDAGGLNNLPSAGSVYIFEKDQGGVDFWGQVKKIVANDRAAADKFGFDVAIEGANIVVGAPYEDEDANGLNRISESGSVYLFNKDFGGANSWGQVKKIVPNDRVGQNELFGFSLCLNGSKIVVGMPRDSHNENGLIPLLEPGSVYIFDKDFGGIDNWGQTKKIAAFDRKNRDYFGTAVAFNGSTLIIGSPSSTLNEDFGSAYIYSRDLGGINQWGLVKKITGSDKELGDNFGNAIALSGSISIVGALNEDEDPYGKFTQLNSGSAYFFTSCSNNNLASNNTTVITSQTNLTNYYNANCNIVITVQSGGVYTVAGHTTAKLWLETIQPTNFTKRHYEITPLLNPNTATGKLTLYFTNQEFIDYNAMNTIKLPESQNSQASNIAAIANLRIEKHSGTSSDGSGLPNTYTGSTTIIDPLDTDIVWNSTQNRWEVSFEVTGFSGFFLTTNTSNPLPVRLISFTGKPTDKGNLLEWKTNSEQNFSHYEVERSADAKSFEKIGRMDGAGNNKENLSYSFLDNQLFGSQSNSNINQASSPIGGGGGYYRLKMIDLDGKSEYSKVISIKTNAETEIKVYPNPAVDFVNIENTAGKQLAIRIMDALGKEIKPVINSSNQNIKIELDTINKGIYFLQINDGIKMNYRKVILGR